ncbi:MAG TPA: hypothetical protein VEY06_02105 [Flavisolibacter sp.]|nr:hypothetical protein [Flavisolibacter sp.]
MKQYRCEFEQIVILVMAGQLVARLVIPANRPGIKHRQGRSKNGLTWNKDFVGFKSISLHFNW